MGQNKGTEVYAQFFFLDTVLSFMGEINAIEIIFCAKLRVIAHI